MNIELVVTAAEASSMTPRHTSVQMEVSVALKKMMSDFCHRASKGLVLRRFCFFQT